jgi:hypothetical protein
VPEESLFCPVNSIDPKAERIAAAITNYLSGDDHPWA